MVAITSSYLQFFMQLVQFFALLGSGCYMLLVLPGMPSKAGDRDLFCSAGNMIFIFDLTIVTVCVAC